MKGKPLYSDVLLAMGVSFVASCLIALALLTLL